MVVVGGVGDEEETAEDVVARRGVDRPTRVRWSARECADRRLAILAPIPDEAPVTTMWRAIFREDVRGVCALCSCVCADEWMNDVLMVGVDGLVGLWLVWMGWWVDGMTSGWDDGMMG